MNEVQSLLKKKEETLKEKNENFSDTFEKIYNYVNHFGKFENMETMKEVRNFFKKFNEGQEPSKKLTDFQIVSIINLLPEDREKGVDEVYALIPSIKSITKLSEFEVKTILEELENFKKFI